MVTELEPIKRSRTELPSGLLTARNYPQEGEEFLEKQDTYSWKSKTLIPGKARHLFLEKPDTNCLAFPEVLD